MRRGQVTITAAAAILCFVWLLLVLAAVSNIPPKTMANTLVNLAPSKSIVAPNENFTVDIQITPASGVNVAGAQFDLDFNTKAVKINSVVEGNLLKQGGANTYFMAGTIDNSAGTLRAVASAIITPGQSVSNPGVLATLSCTALAAGQSSAFALSNVIVGNKDAVALPLESPTVGQVDVALSEDINGDGKVDLADMQMVAAVFGTSGSPGFRREDVNGDGQINVLDLILVGQNFD